MISLMFCTDMLFQCVSKVFIYHDTDSVTSFVSLWYVSDIEHWEKGITLKSFAALTAHAV